MQINLLAFTTDNELPTRLSSLTSEGEEIITHVVGTAEELRESIGAQHFDAVLIDAATSELPLDQVIDELAQQQPGLRFLVLPPDNDIIVKGLDETINLTTLARPLVDEDLKTALADLFNPPDFKLEPAAGLEEENLQETPQDEAYEPSLIEIIDAAEFESDHTVELQSAQNLPVNENPDLLTILDSPQIESPPETQEQAGAASHVISALQLSYCCVLVPRHPNQYLVRDLADRAASILLQLHLSRGWRVTGISVRPQYLQWVISLPVETNPVEAIQEIRQRSSAHLFMHFPELAPAGHNQDFWAPGYLMMSGSQALAPAIIEEFIQRARVRMNSSD